jgi:general L-amino acid transport system permease protein
MYVREKLAESRPAPRDVVGKWVWVKENLLSSPLNIILTVAGGAFACLMIYAFLNFTLFTAVWTGEDRDACLAEKVGREVGACWPMISAKIGQYMYGLYSFGERWRVDLTFVLGFALLIPLLMPRVPHKGLNALAFFAIFPFVAFYLLVGRIPLTTTLAYILLIAAIGFLVLAFFTPAKTSLFTVLGIASLVAFYPLYYAGLGALAHVDTQVWGGFLVSLVVAITGIVASFPIGILLAMGRRGNLPVVRYICVGFIEFVRGVPLITILFFATYVLPFFIPRSWSPDGMLRVLIGVSLFSAAYLAEIIRGGLQAIPKGQFEGAQALGLTYPKMMGLIILPQAIKHVIPSIVNTFIGLFKDTTLVIIVSIFDLLGQLRASLSDSKWASPSSLFTAFAFAGIVYFICCYAMSRYSLYVERRLNTGHKR